MTQQNSEGAPMLTETLANALSQAQELQARAEAAEAALEPLKQENTGLHTALTEQTLKVTDLTAKLVGVTGQRDRAWLRDEKYKVDVAKYEAEIKRLQGLEATYKGEVTGLRKELDDLKLKIKVA